MKVRSRSKFANVILGTCVARDVLVKTPGRLTKDRSGSIPELAKVGSESASVGPEQICV